MKKLLYAMCGVLLLTPGVGASHEISADVKSESGMTVECKRVIIKDPAITKSKGDVTVTYQLSMGGAERLPENSTTLTLAGQAIEGKIQPEVNSGAVWAVVVDDSDTDGRNLTIYKEIGMAAKLVMRMSPNSRVGVYSLARDIKLLGGKRWITDGFETYREVEPGVVSEEVFTKFITDCFPEWRKKVVKLADPSSKSNTNLWSGLTNLINTKLPLQKRGEYAYLPRNIILLSDGVDENGKEEDLIKLAELAKSANVRIHTIAYPFKDKKEKKVTDTERQKGYGNLSRLSEMTGGRHAAVSADTCRLENEVNVLTSIMSTGEVHQLDVEIPKSAFDNLFKVGPQGGDLIMTMYQGENPIARFTVAATDVARFYAVKELKMMQLVIELVKQEKKKEEKEKLLINAGIRAMELIRFANLEKLIAESGIDDGLRGRLTELQAYVKNHPRLQEEAEMIPVAGEFICGLIQLPVLDDEQGEGQSQVVVQPVPMPSDGAGIDESEDREAVLGWVWWILALGGTALCILIFYCVARMTGREPKDPSVTIVSGGVPATSASNGPTQPVLASLVNTADRSKSWPISNAQCSVGRHSRNNVTLPFEYVSSTQFFLKQVQPGEWELKDANSTNGTMVNGRKVNTESIHSGDLIRIADLELEFKIR